MGRLLVYANAGLFCDGYILSSIGLALVTLAPHFGLNAAMTGLTGAATLLGIFVGAPLFGRFTDRFGRRSLMIADLAVFVIASVAQVFVANAWELIALRFVLGIAIGADYPIAAALIAESVPDNVRGAAMNSMQVAWFLGAAVAYVAGYTFLHVGGESWRYILASPAFFAAIGLLMRASAPESPLWVKARDAGDVSRSSFATIFAPAYRGSLAFVSAMWLLQVVPLFAIYTFAPTVLQALGLGASSVAGSVAITAAFLTGSLVSLPLVESWGRRPLCVA
ncbi:MAG: MFS transporter, partial [Candidatus Eremiobacteraeota bacterium]|nr:MFS transporter [Candidatus Eremiobacteraeota bacterium]